ncbi:MAG TPA: hypothetical protein VLD62_04580, partial [Acidimicrobiia bacterium]|nr:hypothetical protein [Acidimicrobiia bacterium]
MGQPISVLETTVVGDVLMIDTDRSITGQDGSGFGSAAEAAEAATFPGELAGRLFSADDAVAGVFVASNQVVVERTGGWDDATTAAAESIVANFFVFYG